MSKVHSTSRPVQNNPSQPPTTGSTTRKKPAKPYPEFPLYAHPTGYWAKKIRGKFYYFGRWTDPDGALQRYLEQKDDLHAGRTPRPDPDALTVKDLANVFLNRKKERVDTGELSPRTWGDYKAACTLLLTVLGKGRAVASLGPDDFAKVRSKITSHGWSAVRVRDFVRRIRSLFNYGFKVGKMDRPVLFGEFNPPSQKTMRLERAKRGPKLFGVEEIHRMLAVAGTQLRAMILLGINCGYGNADCGTLPLSAVNLESGWINYPRPKTGINRRCPLWPETTDALKEAIANRPKPKCPEDSGLVFLTKHGHRWHKKTEDNPVSKETAKLLRELGINGRKGLGFYTLRHTFRTIADESRDQPAIDLIMGHARDDMASVYRERISDERLIAVTDYVRRWLFGKEAEAKIE
jgi:integrase